MISASQLYDHLKCNHKTWRDAYGPQDEKIEEENAFLKLLWQNGKLHEAQVLDQFDAYDNLSTGNIDQRLEKTLAHLDNKSPVIYQGLIQTQNKRGVPDLIILKNGNYYPVDIKSGSAFDNEKLKSHYVVQLAMYIDILRELNYIDHYTGFIIDNEGNMQEYDLTNNYNEEFSYWDFYKRTLAEVERILDKKQENIPALNSNCKQCTWYKSCLDWAVDKDDPTLLYRCSKSNRDTLKSDADVITIKDLSEIDIDVLLKLKKNDKEKLKGLGKTTLTKLKLRAELYSKNGKPIIYQNPAFPIVDTELFFDIEDDPTQDFVYMHGLYLRSKNEEKYIHFTASEITENAEKEAWSNFWQFINELDDKNYAVYYYSHHEQSTYEKLQLKYPEVIDKESLDSFFGRANTIDLYKIVSSHTEWPVGSYSLKSLAVYLGFNWRDSSPSGALSIQWFNEYIQSKDEEVLKRILEYNEDDCKATLVLKDGIQEIYNKQSHK